MKTLLSFWKYFKTICKHKWIVFRECAACGIFWQGVTHDMSKFTPTEFFSSAKYYYGDKSPHYGDAEENGYSAAWLYHKGHNKHHWEYWTDFDEKTGEIKVNIIPYKYVVEMVCDWIGAGKVYEKAEWTQASPVQYYYKVRSGRHFHKKTETLVVYFLRKIETDGLAEFHKLAKNTYLQDLYNDKNIPFHLK